MSPILKQKDSLVRRRVSKFGDDDGHYSTVLNPFGNSPALKNQVRKRISGPAIRNHDESFLREENVEVESNTDFWQLGLVQQHERLVDYVGTEEYQNKCMMLAAAVDSVYASAIVVGIVGIGVISIVYYELMESEQKNCFGRDFPVQEMITLCCLSGYVIELLLRGFGHGWRQFYSFKFKNANTLFDGAVVAGLDPPFLWIVCGLFLPTLRTWRNELVKFAKCGLSLCKPKQTLTNRH